MTEAELEALYAAVPGVACKRLCQACCGPVVMTALEWHRIAALSGSEPRPTAAQRQDLACPLLAPDGSCSVHAVRPLICRLWGVSPRMPCPHGCRPDREFDEAEAREIMERYLASAVRLRSPYPELLGVLEFNV